MRKLIIFSACILVYLTSNAQELNCLVNINYNQVQGSNTQIFKTLEKSLFEFINQTKWTNKEVKSEERIDCAMNIIVTQRENNRFTASLQIQATRPVYETTYATPLLNLNDNDFNFTYNEFDPLFYNKNSFDSNLISTIVYYVYIILGIDADSFSRYGGTIFLKEARNVMLQAQQSGLSSWQNVVGKQNRFLLIDNLLSSNLQNYRTAIYNYHRLGLDQFSKKPLQAKQSIESSIFIIESLFNKTVGNYLIRLFFDAKADEIVNVFTDGEETRDQRKLIQTLQKISTTNSSKWKKIK